MRGLLALLSVSLLSGQTAQELVRKNLDARGGIEKLKAIKTLRMTGKVQMGSMTAEIAADAMAPNLLRQNFTLQGMTAVQAYDGKTGWKISPFEGRKDAELAGDEELRSLVEEADFYGPLADYQANGSKVEYVGHDTVDGDDVYRLKVTLKNGDIYYYYLDPETFLEIRIERVQFIRGAVHETVIECGSYKKVAGVYFPFTVEEGTRQNPAAQKVTFEKIEANVAIDPAEFKMPVRPAAKKKL
jgi:outer membrane lipoprotein-sorting protein